MSIDQQLPNEDARRYVCTSCDSEVRARWTGAAAFHIGCDCTTVPVVPQMGQGETPDSWIVERPKCCEGVAPPDMERTYDSDVSGGEYQCAECCATYDWDGSMVTPPAKENESKINQQENALSDF